tara:strand:- start:19338 stop:20144 length:807 start_codon:yes stop_codon:yes gene_type:complete
MPKDNRIFVVWVLLRGLPGNKWLKSVIMALKTSNFTEAGREQRYRYERKFTVPSHYSMSQMQMVVKSNPAMFREIYNERKVNNIYMDTPNHQFYHDNVLGVSDRKKVRIRWYGLLSGEIRNPVLEIKIKKGLVGDKWSFPLQTFDFDNTMNKRKLQAIFQASNLPPSILEITRNLGPTLVNSYHRKYYLSVNKAFRITLDSNISYYHIHQNFNHINTIGHRDSQAVMELKYALDDDGAVDRITAHLPFRMDKKSKYISGIDCFNTFAQ